MEQLLLAELHFLNIDTRNKLDNLKRHFIKQSVCAEGQRKDHILLGFIPLENVFWRYFPNLARAPAIKIKLVSITSPAILKATI